MSSQRPRSNGRTGISPPLLFVSPPLFLVVLGEHLCFGGPAVIVIWEVGGCEASIIKDHDTLSDPCLLDARTRESTLEKFAAKMTGGRRDI